MAQEESCMQRTEIPQCLGPLRCRDPRSRAKRPRTPKQCQSRKARLCSVILCGNCWWIHMDPFPNCTSRNFALGATQRVM